jgi:signal transduction histidine kinase
MKLTFERKLPIILFFVFLMLTATGLLFYQRTDSLQQALSRQRHSQEVVSTLDDALAMAVASESEQRGFIVTGNTTYLDRFERRKRLVNDDLARLRALEADSPPHLAALAGLEEAVANFWQIAESKIESRKQGGYAAGIEEASLLGTKTGLEAVRIQVEGMKSTEFALLQGRTADFERDQARATWALIMATLAGFVALGVANFLVLRESRRRSNAEANLVDANRTLESKVEERTRELKNVNESLALSAAERQELLEREQEARREAEIANRLRDEFMATVSHELRTPLNSILGWARLLKNGTLNESQKTKALRTIIRSSESQNLLIDDLLDAAKMISGKIELDHSRVRLSDIVGDSVESLRPAASEKNIEMNYRPAGAERLAVEGDIHRLGQVFNNLLTNAVKFTPIGGRVEVRLIPNGKTIDVEVADNGAGISAELLPKVFERFRQGSKSEDRRNGLGLGLAIVRNLVEMHGGRVKAASEGEDRGATFTVTLPLASNGVG